MRAAMGRHPQAPPTDYTGLTTIMTPHLVAQAEADVAVMLAAMERQIRPRRTVGPYFILDPIPPAKGAKVARERLRGIVAQDREACPAWRWVRKPQRSKLILPPGHYTVGQVQRMLRRAAFRWERRR